MSYEKEIEGVREKIEEVDREILEKVLQRVDLAQKGGKIKRKHGKPILDEKREREVIEKARKLGEKKGIKEEKIEDIFQEIIKLCREEEYKT